MGEVDNFLPDNTRILWLLEFSAEEEFFPVPASPSISNLLKKILFESHPSF